MDNHSSSDIDIETTEATKRGLTRRQVAVGAAWAAPVIALAVATPFAAASTVFDAPTAYLTGSMTGTTSGSGSTANHTISYSTGAASYDNAGTATTSGNFLLTMTWTNPTPTGTYAIVGLATVQAGFASFGWTLVSSDAGILVYSHGPVASGSFIHMPTITWAGKGKVKVNIDIESDNGDVGGSGLQKSFT